MSEDPAHAIDELLAELHGDGVAQQPEEVTESETSPLGT
jgi:hypothetical protein